MTYVNGWYLLVDNVLSEENMYIYVFLLMSLSIIYIGLIKRQLKSIFDPFTMTIITSITAISVPIAFVYNGLAYDKDIAINFIISELAFVVGSCVFFNRVVYDNRKSTVEWNGCYIVTFIVFSVIYLLTQMGSILIFGSAFGEIDRLAIYGGGNGVLQSISLCLRVPVIFFLVHMWFVPKGVLLKLYSYIVWMTILVGIVNTGAKSSFIIVVNVLFLYSIYNKDQSTKIKKYMTIFLSFTIFMACLIAYLNVGTGEGMLYSLIYRMIGNGDVFAYYLGDNFNGSLKLSDSLIEALLSSSMAFLRIITYDSFTPIGQQLSQLINPYSFMTFAPNQRHNLIGYIYLGSAGAILFSFILGVIMSYIRNVMIYKCRQNIILFMFGGVVYISCCSIPADPSLFFEDMVKMIIIDGSLLGISLLINCLLKKCGDKCGNEV